MEEYGWGKMNQKNHPYQIYCIFLLKLTNFMKFTGEEKITTSNHPIKKDKKPLKNKQQKRTNGEMNTKKIKKIQRLC